MKNIKFVPAILLVAIFLLPAYTSVQPPKPKFSSPTPERKLVIDKNLIKYINKQAAKDAPEQVIIFADTIIITANDTFGNFDLRLYANYFKVEANRGLTVMPSGSGQTGKNILLVAKKIDGGTIHLPGTPGKAGATGKKGKDGDPQKLEDDIKMSLGTRGEPGQKGENGGDGGKLTVHSVTTALLTFIAKEGGAGGPGGPGGQGGLTYFRPITKIINQGKPNEKIIYGATKSRREANGASGPAGEKGKDGVVTKNVITEAKFDEMATKAYMEDWKNIAGNGWRIFFKNKETE